MGRATQLWRIDKLNKGRVVIKMIKLYIKYLKFCKKHSLKAIIPKRYAFLLGYFSLKDMELTEDVFTFKEMLKKLKENDGYCPCALKKIPNTKCPCLSCRSKNNCHCGLYERKGNADD